ncbi:MAG: galactose-1-phosphate uridylyltransferase [Candidatus Riflebacteria bacterium]|nr:galactose-1-phosphate uridylyltransferase [Candidatus Riflebacteria bacterium]
MPQLRKDPVTKRWVIINFEKSLGAADYKIPRASHTAVTCPFCPGRESMTPLELMSYREPNTLPNQPGWKVRVIPNRYPALQIEGELDRTGIGLYDMMNGIGAHEVVIESPEHNLGPADFTPEHWALIVGIYADRYRDLKRDQRFRYILIFKNNGIAAGASLEHPHSQLIATPIIPKRVMEEIEGARQYYYYKERCVFCDIIRQELSSGDRIITENESFVAYAPFASRFPFETCIAPKEHKASFGALEDSEMESLANIISATLKKLVNALGDPPFNYIIHTSPCDGNCDEYYHWHLEIMPRLTKVAGFEWGSGFYVNPTPPELAAKQLIQSISQPKKVVK